MISPASFGTLRLLRDPASRGGAGAIEDRTGQPRARPAGPSGQEVEGS